MVLVPAGNIRAGAVRLVFNKVVASLLGLPSDPAAAEEGLKVLKVRPDVPAGHVCRCQRDSLRCVPAAGVSGSTHAATPPSASDP